MCVIKFGYKHQLDNILSLLCVEAEKRGMIVRWYISLYNTVLFSLVDFWLL